MAKLPVLLTLKHVCRERGIDLDARAARRILRNQLGSRHGRWTWREGEKELETVRRILREAASSQATGPRQARDDLPK